MDPKLDGGGGRTKVGKQKREGKCLSLEDGRFSHPGRHLNATALPSFICLPRAECVSMHVLIYPFISALVALKLHPRNEMEKRQRPRTLL